MQSKKLHFNHRDEEDRVSPKVGLATTPQIPTPPAQKRAFLFSRVMSSSLPLVEQITPRTRAKAGISFNLYTASNDNRQ